jgi:hypothetical protein
MYMASQAFRFAVTAEPEARANALKAFTALELLLNVTGVPGFPARSVLSPEEPAPTSGPWAKSPTMPGWWFKYGTSSDEIDGHLFASPLFYDLVAQDDTERARAVAHADVITSGIVRNNFTLVGIFGNHTQWGRWDPPYVNYNPGAYDARGLQSLQIAAFLLSAARLTGKDEYLTAWTYLAQEQGYDINLINQDITIPDDTNFSDWELAAVPLLTLLRLKGDLAARVSARECAARTHRINRRERSSLFLAVYAIGNPDDTDAIEDALWTLRTYPVSQINWPVRNSQRMDIIDSRDKTRMNTKQIRELLPYNENGLLRWNGNPFSYQTIDGGSGLTEYDPTGFLLPYWLLRYLNVLG